MKAYRVQCRLGGYLIVSEFKGQNEDTIQKDFINELEKGNYSVENEGVYRPDRLYFFYEEINYEPRSKQKAVGQKDGA
jgi:intein/homing endonuclease